MTAPRRSLGEAISTVTFAVVGAGLALESLGGAQHWALRAVLGVCALLSVAAAFRFQIDALARRLRRKR